MSASGALQPASVSELNAAIETSAPPMAFTLRTSRPLLVKKTPA